jgi:ribosomal protein L44E
MGRRTILVDKIKLQNIINRLEEEQEFTTQGQLCEAAAEKYTAQEGIKITSSVVYLRIKEFGIEIKTKSGKRGRGGLPNRGNNEIKRISRKEKFQANPTIQIALAKINKATPERFRPMAERIRKGSMKAALQLKCLDCSDYSTTEVKRCGCNDCPLWVFRPYQDKTLDDTTC